MSKDKIELHRRGFLARILKGAAATAVASAAVIEVTENKAGATSVKVVEQESSYTTKLFNRKDWPSMEELESKLDTEILSDLEIYQLAWYMQNCRNGNRIIFAYSKAQKQVKNLVRLHTLVAVTIVAVATGKVWHMVSEPNWGTEQETRDISPEFSQQSFDFTKPR